MKGYAQMKDQLLCLNIALPYIGKVALKDWPLYQNSVSMVYPFPKSTTCKRGLSTCVPPTGQHSGTYITNISPQQASEIKNKKLKVSHINGNTTTSKESAGIFLEEYFSRSFQIPLKEAQHKHLLDEIKHVLTAKELCTILQPYYSAGFIQLNVYEIDEALSMATKLLQTQNCNPPGHQPNLDINLKETVKLLISRISFIIQHTTGDQVANFSYSVYNLCPLTGTANTKAITALYRRTRFAALHMKSDTLARTATGLSLLDCESRDISQIFSEVLTQRTLKIKKKLTVNDVVQLATAFARMKPPIICTKMNNAFIDKITTNMSTLSSNEILTLSDSLLTLGVSDKVFWNELASRAVNKLHRMSTQEVKSISRNLSSLGFINSNSLNALTLSVHPLYDMERLNINKQQHQYQHKKDDYHPSNSHSYHVQPKEKSWQHEKHNNLQLQFY